MLCIDGLPALHAIEDSMEDGDVGFGFDEGTKELSMENEPIGATLNKCDARSAGIQKIDGSNGVDLPQFREPAKPSMIRAGEKAISRLPLALVDKIGRAHV